MAHYNESGQLLGRQRGDEKSGGSIINEARVGWVFEGRAKSRALNSLPHVKLRLRVNGGADRRREWQPIGNAGRRCSVAAGGVIVDCARADGVAMWGFRSMDFGLR